MPDGSQWLASGTLYSKNMLISGKNRAVASTYFKADATAPFFILVAMSGCPQTCMIKLRIASCSALPQCSTHSHPAPLQARDAPLRSRPAPTRVFTGLLLRSYPRCCQVPQLRSRGSYRARRRSSCSASSPGWGRSSTGHSQTSRRRAGSAAGGTCLRC